MKGFDVAQLNSYNLKANALQSAYNTAGYAAYKFSRDLIDGYVKGVKPQFRNVKFYEGNEPERGGLFGLPVFSTIHFGRVSETEKPIQWVRVFNKETLPRLTLDCVLMTIHGSKTIVKTDVMGQHKMGTVKEFMGYNDYEIRITGVLFNAKENMDKYPIKQVNDLRRICEAPVSVPVLNDVLNRMGVMNVVIEDWSFTQYPGKENVQPFELSCVSDTPMLLKIKNKTEAYENARIYGGDVF